MIIPFFDRSDETFKHVAVLSETLHDPVFGHSDEPNQCARSKAFNTDLTAFKWLELPENSYRRRRFGVFMDGLSKVQLLDATWSGGFHKIFYECPGVILR